MKVSRFIPAGVKTLALACFMVGTASYGADYQYLLKVEVVDHFKGQSVEKGRFVSFANGTTQRLKFVFDPAFDPALRLKLPDGVTSFELEASAGQSVLYRFETPGFYRYALVFDGGEVKTGELAVVESALTVVDIVGMSFSPQVIQVKRGTMIQWINTTGSVHTVTTDPQLARNPANASVPEGAEVWHSGNIEPGQAFSKVLTVPGEYRYFCKPHEVMGHVGTIVVE